MRHVKEKNLFLPWIITRIFFLHFHNDNKPFKSLPLCFLFLNKFIIMFLVIANPNVIWFFCLLPDTRKKGVEGTEGLYLMTLHDVHRLETGIDEWKIIMVIMKKTKQHIFILLLSWSLFFALLTWSGIIIACTWYPSFKKMNIEKKRKRISGSKKVMRLQEYEYLEAFLSRTRKL